MQGAVVGGHPFDGGDRRSIGLDGEHQACSHGPAVDQDGAGSADAVLASEVGAGEPEIFAQCICEGLAGLDVDGGAFSVDGEFDSHQWTPALFPIAWFSARSVNSSVIATR